MRSRGFGAGAVLLGLGVLVALAACELVVPVPTADFDISPVVVYAGEAVTLDASASSGDLVDYTWTVGETSTESGRRVTTTFPQPGAYTIRLAVEDSQGRIDAFSRELIVYARSGTRVFYEDFGDGEAALGRWPLDPSWASQNESEILHVSGNVGYCLFVHSGTDRFHRRAAAVELPPLRVGQKLSFSFRVMTVETQNGHAFTIAPGRSRPELPAQGLPYFVFSSDAGGSYIREPSAYGTETPCPVAFRPLLYQWHTYVLTYSADEYTFSVDQVLWRAGSMELNVTRGGTWWIVLGDESQTEACSTYYDTILVVVDE